jgi:hypothetical protein
LIRNGDINLAAVECCYVAVTLRAVIANRNASEMDATASPEAAHDILLRQVEQNREEFTREQNR